MLARKSFGEQNGATSFLHMAHSRVVMILFRPALCKEALNVCVDKNGRFLIVRKCFR